MNEKELKELDEFIDRIWPLYARLEWTWADDNIPSKKQLKNKVIDLIDELKLGIKYDSLTTGGLYVERVGEGLMEYGMRITGNCFEE